VDWAVVALAVANAAVGMGLSIPVLKVVRAAQEEKASILRGAAGLVGIYVAECLLLGMGMTVPLFNVPAAFLWGWRLGRRVPRWGREARRAAIEMGIYTSLPAVSIIMIPILAWYSGWDVFTVEGSRNFGVPASFPWPTNTILGFYACAGMGALVLKVLITSVTAGFLVRRRSFSRP